MEIYDDYVDHQDSKNPFKRFAVTTEDHRAVILGFKYSLEFIFIVDFLVCIALIYQGAILMSSTDRL